MKRGFTLVELSIVLVIIGLLIGGILVGQSMIETAKVQKLVRQITDMKIMVANFETAYNSVPGDSPLFNPPGDGNGSTCHVNVCGFTGEVANYFVHLQEGGMLDGKGATYSSTIVTNYNSSTTAPNVPKIAISKSNSVGFALYFVTAPDSITYLIGELGGCTNLINGTCAKGAFSKTLLEAVDIKIDDGNINTGNVEYWGLLPAGPEGTYGIILSAQ